MPNDNTLKDDFREIARQEADKNSVVSVDNLPEVQKVEVTNPPEPTEVNVDLSNVENVLKSILRALKVGGKEINLSKVEKPLQGILEAVSREIEAKEVMV